MRIQLRLAAGLCALLCLLLPLCGCGRADPGPAATESGPAAAENGAGTETFDQTVRLRHAGGVYTPELYTVSSRSAEQETYAAHIQALQAAETLTEDMWVSLPVEFVYGGGLQRQEYTLYRLQKDERPLKTETPQTEGKSEPSGWTVCVPVIPLYRHAADFTAPEEPGRYLCIAEVCFAADAARTVSEFVFAFETLGPDGTAEPVPPDRHVILHTAAGDYTPRLRPTWSLHNGVAADALPILPQDAAEALTEDMWLELPVEFDYGEPLRGQSYDIYTLPQTKPVARQEVFEPPEEPGAYLCIAQVTFGTDREYDGCQYVFGFGVGGVAYSPYAAEPPMGGVILHGEDGDLTPALRLLLDERYGGIVTEMPAIGPEEAAAALTDDMRVALPLEIEFCGPIRIESYEICTPDGKRRLYRGTSFVPPEEPGTYLCLAKADFRSDGQHTCWQYFFAFTVK